MTVYLQEADDLYESERARIAAEVGGGQCGPGPATMLASGCLALAGSRYLYSTCDASQLALAAKLATESRQHFLAAHTWAALQAEARAKAQGVDPLAALKQRMAAVEAEGDSDGGA
jgi:hypothetical protein